MSGTSAKALPYLDVRKGHSDLKLQPVTDYLALARQYSTEYPSSKCTMGHLDAYDAESQRQSENSRKLRLEAQRWDPSSDANLSGTDPYKTVFVGRLSYTTDELRLQQVFAKYGELVKVRVVRDPASGKSRGYAFILFKDSQTARVCTREIGVHRGIEIDGRRCIVDIERGRTVRFFKPRRLGGGLGGRGYTNAHKPSSRAIFTVSSHKYQDSHSQSPSHVRTHATTRYNASRDRTPHETPQPPAPRTTYRPRNARQEIDY